MLLHHAPLTLPSNLILILDNVFVHLKTRWGVKTGGTLDLSGTDQALRLNIVTKDYGFDSFKADYF
uniref:Uncharacterized protein n=1 Tax=Physcomitrium patens TaxID=3218 RepID=A0A2K1K326_PHYPA|nr:hypothetical protein PHYPA_012660 [Physcomitrium patens]